MIKATSKRFQLNAFDWYSGFRDIFLMIISFAVTNIDIIQTLLTRYNVSKEAIAVIVGFILEMGRRFIREIK